MQDSHRYERPDDRQFRAESSHLYVRSPARREPPRPRALMVWGTLLTVLASFAAAKYTPGGASHPAGFELGGRPQSGPVTAAAPAFISRNGVDYQLQQVPVAAVLRTPAGSDQLQLYVLQPPETSSPGCNQLQASVRLVKQTPDAVSVAAFGYKSPVTAASKNVTCNYGTEGTQALYHRFVVTLDEPIGSRKIVDTKSGQVAGMLDDSELLTPTYLPSGFRLTVNHGFDATTGFVGLRQYTNGSSAIEIRTRSATVWPASGTVVGTATVNDNFARISNQAFERCVTWQDQPGLVREVCSLGSNKTFLPADQLLKIANGLH